MPSVTDYCTRVRALLRGAEIREREILAHHGDGHAGRVAVERTTEPKPGAIGAESPGASVSSIPATSTETRPCRHTSVVTESASASSGCSLAAGRA